MKNLQGAIQDAIEAGKKQEIEALVDATVDDYNRGCEAENEADDQAYQRAERIIRQALSIFITEHYEEIFEE